MKTKQEEIRLFITGLAVEHTFSSDDIAKVKKQNKHKLRYAKINKLFSIMAIPMLLSISLTALLISIVAIGTHTDPSLKIEDFSYDIVWNIGEMLFITILAMVIGIKFLKSGMELPLSNYRKELYISLYHSLDVAFHKQVRKAVSQHILDPDKNPFIEYNAIFHIDNPRFFEIFFVYTAIPMKEMDRLLLGRGLSLCDRRKKCSAETEARNV